MNAIQQEIKKDIAYWKEKLENTKTDNIHKPEDFPSFASLPWDKKIWELDLSHYQCSAWTIRKCVLAIMELNHDGFTDVIWRVEQFEKLKHTLVEEKHDLEDCLRLHSQHHTKPVRCSEDLYEGYQTLFENIRTDIFGEGLSDAVWEGEKTLILPHRFKAWADSKKYKLPDELCAIFDKKKHPGSVKDIEGHEATKAACAYVLKEIEKCEQIYEVRNMQMTKGTFRECVTKQLEKSGGKLNSTAFNNYWKLKFSDKRKKEGNPSKDQKNTIERFLDYLYSSH